MYNRSLLLELLLEIEEAIRRIERRFTNIDAPADFTRDDAGLDRLDGISMMLIAISENIRRIEKTAGHELLAKETSVDWESVKGIRNILDHNYFDIDADEIYAICSRDLINLKQAISLIRQAIFN
ncbi:MAG: HepT-like ribonuclease domain-containing protein [Cyanobacteria bacterium P01_D01_bin.6]